MREECITHEFRLKDVEKNLKKYSVKQTEQNELD